MFESLFVEAHFGNMYPTSSWDIDGAIEGYFVKTLGVEGFVALLPHVDLI